MNHKLLENLKSDDKKKILDALEEIGETENEIYCKSLLDTLQVYENESEIMESIVWSLNRCAKVETILQLLNSKNESLILEVIDAIGRRAEKIDASKLLPFLNSKDEAIRAMTVWALGKINADETRDHVKNLLKFDKDVEVRGNAAWVLQKFGIKEDLPFLQKIILEEKDDLVLYKLTDAIQSLETKTSISKGEEINYNCPNFTHECEKIDKNELSTNDSYISINILEAKNCKLAKVCKIRIKKLA